MSDDLPEIELSSGNIWADIGRPDADEAFARAQLMSRVTDLIRARRLTQAQAAKVLGTNQPTVSDLVRGKMSKFSLERLIAFLNALDQDVEITVRPRPKDESDRPGRTVVAPG
ncbi:MAG TPA: helix-turn-helix transcriptional regulator [Longimicrobium sp.]|nr:helix-turn-helix transcriptional regulator [Longimicrobium sp.]